MELKELFAQQKLLKFEISQTRRAKKLATIEKAIAQKLTPAKERAKKVSANTGRDSGKFKIDNETVAWSVAMSDVKAHTRTTVKITAI
tara:strand:+ start:809 stop:1072 length:264 start_codon:yes stop_codon:yes gene_type:complete